MNEPLCRALLRAGLTEEDVAVRLGVDPKTVRRWMEGRALPYPRHRWALAAMLGADEADLWPQLRVGHFLPEEVQAVYPHAYAVPRGAWLRLFGSAEREIDVLDGGEFAGRDPGSIDVLADRARAGVMVRVCLACPAPSTSDYADIAPVGDSTSAVLALFAPVREISGLEIRLHQATLYNTIKRADNQLLVAQRAYGIPAEHAPVLHLWPKSDGGLVNTYLQLFNRIWDDARPLG